MLDRNLNALPPGTIIDGYRIERELGSGGFGITYFAIEIESGRKVAIKEYMPKSFAQRGPGDLSIRPVNTEAKEHFDWGLDRFRDEARALIRLHHPNIVLTLRLFSAHGTAYIVMNYVEGESLATLLKRDLTLTDEEIDELIDPLLDALSAVHEAGYLHRDLKPANIYIRRADGRPVILDFGAAREALGRETMTLSAIVTPGYSPPEQYGRGAKQKESADIYALGATLYRCMTGAVPAEAPDRVSAMVMSQPDPMLPAAEAARGKYSAGVLAAVDAALRIRENERPQSIAAFRALVRGAGPAPPAVSHPAAEPAAPLPARHDDGTLMAGRAGAPPPSRISTPPAGLEAGQSPTRRRHWILAAGLGGVLLAGAVGAWVAINSPPQPGEMHLPTPGTAFRDCPACPEMVVVPAGSFTMGSAPSDSSGYADERPPHKVSIEKIFALGKYEVTFEEYDAFLLDTGVATRPGDRGWGRGRQPVINVAWRDAKAYVAWLSRKTGKAYRLPSEAEWEYSARAGSTTQYSWGDDVGRNRANCAGCGSQWDKRQTAPVGSFAPNPFGFHDMHGNVWEWVEDVWHADYVGAPRDGSAWESGPNNALRVVRGGSWDAGRFRAADRHSFDASVRYGDLGFRVARSF